MKNRLPKTLLRVAMLLAFVLFAGCQANRMVFVDNNIFGLKVGADERQIPIVEVGYSSTSGVYMPLVVEETDTDGKTTVVHGTDEDPALYQANGDGSRKDAYSASFI